jgi:hypothetical protein
MVIVEVVRQGARVVGAHIREARIRQLQMNKAICGCPFFKRADAASYFCSLI